ADAETNRHSQQTEEDDAEHGESRAVRVGVLLKRRDRKARPSNGEEASAKDRQPPHGPDKDSAGPGPSAEASPGPPDPPAEGRPREPCDQSLPPGPARR